MIVAFLWLPNIEKKIIEYFINWSLDIFLFIQRVIDDSACNKFKVKVIGALCN
jgi:hypothetical protein